MNEQLGKPDWIRHGLATLAKAGAEALKVGPMSAQLNVSRGSFYWHFRDIADFRSQLLQSWQERTTGQVIQDLAEEPESGRLKFLLRRAFVGQRGLDRAIRSWAMTNKEVAAAVAAVDIQRTGYIASLLVIAGVEDKLALDRATFIYWAYLGQETVLAPGQNSISLGVLDEIGDLFER